jgi:hypothetical protein
MSSRFLSFFLSYFLPLFCFLQHAQHSTAQHLPQHGSAAHNTPSRHLPSPPPVDPTSLWGPSQLKQSNVAISCQVQNSPLSPFSQTSPEQGHHPSFLEKGSLQSEAERGGGCPFRGRRNGAAECEKQRTLRSAEGDRAVRGTATGCSAARTTLICSDSKNRIFLLIFFGVARACSPASATAPVARLQQHN